MKLIVYKVIVTDLINSIYLYIYLVQFLNHWKYWQHVYGNTNMISNMCDYIELVSMYFNFTLFVELQSIRVQKNILNCGILGALFFIETYD